MRRPAVLLSLLFLAVLARAGSVTVVWDAPSQAGITGFRLYHSTHSLLGYSPEDAAVLPSVTVTPVASPALSVVLSLADGATYYFRLTAMDGEPDESDFNVDGAGLDAEASAWVNGAPVLVSILTAGGGRVNAALEPVTVRVRVTGGPGTPASVMLDYGHPGQAGTQASVPMTLVPSTVDEYVAVVPATSTAFRVGGLDLRVRALDSGGGLASASVGTLSVTQSVASAPDAAGRVALPQNLGGWGGTGVDLSPLPPQHRPGKISIDQQAPGSVPAPRGETDLFAQATGGLPGIAYDLRADDKPAVVFPRPVRLTLAYLDADDDGREDTTGADADQLKAFFYDGVSWRFIGGTLDKSNHTLTAATTQLGLYALYAQAPVAALAAASVDTEALAKESHLSPASVDGHGDAAIFGPAARRVRIRNARGRQVFQGETDGVSALVWTARDNEGRIVESGAYLAEITDDQGRTTRQALIVAK